MQSKGFSSSGRNASVEEKCKWCENCHEQSAVGVNRSFHAVALKLFRLSLNYVIQKEHYCINVIAQVKTPISIVFVCDLTSSMIQYPSYCISWLLSLYLR